MHKHAPRWLAGYLCILLFASGCFRPGGAALEATNIAQSAPTFTIPPTNTLPPSDTPEPIPTEGPSDTPIVQTVVVTQIAQLPTQTIDPFAVTQSGNVVVATLTPTLDPFGPTLTPTLDPFVLLGITQVADASLGGAQQPIEDPFAAATATAQAASGAVPIDAAPPVDQAPAQQIDAPFASATALIQQATLTIAFQQTQTQLALLGPTATPTPEQQQIIVTPTLDVAAPTPPPIGGVGGTNCIHVVQRGQNLFRIGLQYNVPFQDIARVNNIANPNLIFPGQQLTIPNTTVACQPVPVTPVPGVTVTPPPTGGGTVHTVMQGETLFQLSLRYGPTVHQIAAANGIQNINLIYIGQQLTIPAV